MTTYHPLPPSVASDPAAARTEYPSGLVMTQWAQPVVHVHGTTLQIPTNAPLLCRLKHSVATGTGLVTNGQLGIDMIRLSAGQGFAPHTHPGDHILIPVGGRSTITFGGGVYLAFPGSVYMVDGNVPHAVGAIDDAVILAVGAPHKPVDSTERMTPVEYQAVLADIDHLLCYVCDPTGTDTDCEHVRPHAPVDETDRYEREVADEYAFHLS